MRSVFARVLCGSDGSAAGLAAARLGARLADPDGVVEVVAVSPRPALARAGGRAAGVAVRPAAEAEEALVRAIDEAEPLHHAEARLMTGGPAGSLLAEIRRLDATVAVVGSRGHSRAVGIALGSVTTFLLHEAPCSVLVAREGAGEAEGWPRSILVGVDGSRQSARALAVAGALAARFGSRLRAVAATREAHVDLDGARTVPGLEEHDDGAVGLLSLLSEEVDLVVVGSRGLRGLRSLGSISERVAHEAHCPVLVVRAPER